jgi:16S rRNA (uracil1498-N3)-methyltransferase
MGQPWLAEKTTLRISRLFFAGMLSENQTVSLDKTQAHYLSHVLRSKPGDSVVLFNGEGGEFPGSIISLSKKSADIALSTQTRIENEAPIEITLLQCISRSEKMDYAIQKATELGVKNIIPIISERSAKLNNPEKKLIHWQRIIQSACEQCGRNRLPVITSPVSFHNAITKYSCQTKIILAPEGTAHLSAIPAPEKDIVLCIGAEGGFMEDELQTAANHSFHLTQLGPRILRTETASVAALSAILFHWGDF